MKISIEIPRDLPRFEGESALFVVSGRQDAVFYSAKDGELERLGAFKVPRPRIDSRTEAKPRGKEMGERSGAVREYGDENVNRDFLREFKKRFAALGKPFDKIFIFAPREMQRKLAGALSDTDRRKIAGEIEGNFYYRHPIDLLKRLAATRSRGFMPESEDEAKILRVPKQ